ncbi:ricin-type beta-trefoil lectin domain protein [Planomonospora algeriensis]
MEPARRARWKAEPARVAQEHQRPYGDGTSVIIWDCHGQSDQKWRFNPDGSITALGAGKCLDVTGNSTANGVHLQIWTCSGAANHRWTRV